MEKIYAMKFWENRVRRNYMGGKNLDALRKKNNPKNSDRPEEWIGSVIEAKNVGLDKIENEGLSYIKDEGTKYLFKDIIEGNPEFYLGKDHIKKYGTNLGFLMKLLDSSMRLHTQAHPTREFAKKYLSSNWGKMECYCVLSTKDESEGYIRLGFQRPINKSLWKDIIENQKIDEMDELFDKIPIKQGDIVYIPGGVPHAIGENVLLIEIMEPSDLVVRCEYEREEIVVPEGARFMGKDLDFCLDIFDYTSYSVQDVKNNFFLNPKTIVANENYEIYKLIDSSKTISFEVFKNIIKNDYTLNLDKRFIVGLVTKGKVKIEVSTHEIDLEAGDSFFIPSGAEKMMVTNYCNESEIYYTSNPL